MMPPTTPRLRILSGQSHSPAQCAAAPLLVVRSISLPPPLRSSSHILSINPPSSSHRNGPADTISVRSGRQCSLRLPVLASVGHKRLRCHAGLEERVRQRVAVRHLIQVRPHHPIGGSATDPSAGRASSATNASNPDMVSPSLVPRLRQRAHSSRPQSSGRPKKQRAPRAPRSTTSSSASRRCPMSTTSPP